MGKHTPGPWVIKGQDIMGNEPNGFICSWSGRSADARLIAAAPDLLDACREFVRKVECREARSKRSYEQMKAAISRVEEK
jgi:hypothetical protein